MDVTITASDLATMSHDDVAKALGFVARTLDADAATVAARRRGTASATQATDDTAPCVVLISAEFNPLT